MTTRVANTDRLSALRQLVGFHTIELDATARRLGRCLTIDDLRAVAARTTPRPVFDYVDGGADDERAMRVARQAFDRVRMHPHVLRDVAEVDTSTTILGERAALPLVLAPTGFTGMIQREAEPAVARAAARARLPYALSTMGTTSAADLAAAAPGAELWFQLYVWRDRARSTELVEHAREAGFRALIVTVDVPVAGARLRDVRNGLTIPPTLTARSLGQIARHPGWWWQVLTGEPITFASFQRAPGSLAELIGTMFDPAVTLDDLAWLRDIWRGPLIVKGVLRVDDARAITALGADALVLSHHGGRQLDRAVPPLQLLPAVLDAVGSDVEVYVDSGVRSGSDLAAAVALGARACLVGRAYLYGLMAGGERGVDHAIELLADQFRRTMQLLGARCVGELTRDLVSLAPSD